MIYLIKDNLTRACEDEQKIRQAIADGWRIVEYAEWQAQRRANEQRRFADLRATCAAVIVQPALSTPDDGPHVEVGADGKPWWW